MIYTDGGPDHLSTYMSVKLSMIALFIELDLDALVALRTAPKQFLGKSGRTYYEHCQHWASRHWHYEKERKR